MQGKTVLITGANTGIGKATALLLAQKGARIIMVCRNKQKGGAALREVQRANPQPGHSLACCDLSSMEQVRDLGRHLSQTYSTLDVLISNAAAFFTEWQLTGEGFERQWAINHLAPFLLTNQLLPNLQAAAAARVVVVSSKGNYKGHIHFEDLNLTKGYTGLKAYRQSKLANVLFANELARKLIGTHVTANSLHPGVVGTQIGYANNNKLPALVWRLGNPFMLTPTQGAATVVYLASSEAVTGVTGHYFDNCRPKRANELAYDEALARRLWEVSARQVGLGG